MTRIDDSAWRIGEQRWSPERGAFSRDIDGRPQVFTFSGDDYLRHDV